MYLLLWYRNKRTCSIILPTIDDVGDMISLLRTSPRVDMEDVKVRRIETGNWVNLNTLEEEM
jgi:hypothetical protein